MQNICYIVTSFDVSFWGEGDTIREGVIGKGRVEGWAGPSGGGKLLSPEHRVRRERSAY